MKSNPPKRGKEAKEKKEMDISKTAYGTPKSKFNLGQVREFIFKVFRTPSIVLFGLLGRNIFKKNEFLSVYICVPHWEGIVGVGV